MAEVRVQLPLGAFSFRVWDSLVVRLRREQESVGSNPTTLTSAGLTPSSASGPIQQSAAFCFIGEVVQVDL